MLVIKRHPNQLLNYDSLSPAITCHRVPTSTVLSVCDCVITDYSAITIEAALLGKPVYFYLFDYEDYLDHNGLNVKLFDEFPTAYSATRPSLSPPSKAESTTWISYSASAASICPI